MLKPGRDYFILFREQKDGWFMNRFGVGNAVEVFWNLQRERTRQQPQIPPAKLAQDHLPERRRIMQNQSSRRPMCCNLKRSRRAEARAKDDNWAIVRLALQRVERG